MLSFFTPCLSRNIHSAICVVTVGVCILFAGCVPKVEDREILTLAIWGSVRNAEIERRIVEAFEAKHTGVEVRLQVFSKGYQEKVQAMMVGGIPPDVFMVDTMFYGDWAGRGVLADLTGLMEEFDAEDPFMPVALDAFQFNDAYYAMPINCGTVVMFCNLDALKSAGIEWPLPQMDWNAFVEMGKRLSLRAGNPNGPVDYLCIAPPPVSLLMSFGVSLFDNPHDPKEVIVDEAKLADALKFYRFLVAENYAPSANAALDTGWEQFFRDGRVAFIFTGRYASTEFTGRTDFEWDIAPAPRMEGAMLEAGGTGLAISARTKVPELAREFLEFYASEEAVKLAIDGGRIVPTRRRFVYSERFLNMEPPENNRLFGEVQEAGSGESLLYSGGLRNIHDIFYRRMEQALAEPEIPAEMIAANIRTDVERWLKLNTDNVTGK